MSTPAPVIVLVRAVTSTTVALGLATGTGPLLGPLAAEFAVGRGTVSTMFSATLFFVLGTGLIAGPAAARHGTRAPALLGAVLVPGGLVVAAVAGSFGPAAVGFALGVGGGAGCLFVPMLAAVGTAFERHRSAALVLATAGGGLGTVLAPPLVHALLAAHGLRATLLLLAAASAGLLLACAAGAGRRPGRAGTGPDGPGPVAVLQEPDFRLLCAASVGVCAAMFVPFVHLAADAAARGPGAAAGAALVAVVGAASVAGRLAAIPVVVRVGAWPVQRAAAAALTAALVLWLPAGGVIQLGVFAVVFGLAHGAFVGLSAAVAAERHGTVGLTARIAALHAAAAVGGLVGPSTAGWAVDLLGRPLAAPAVAVVFGVAGCAALAGVGRQRIPATVPEGTGHIAAPRRRRGTAMSCSSVRPGPARSRR